MIRVTVWGAVAFALALQLQLTISVGTHAVRVALADPLAVMLLPLFAVLAWCQRGLLAAQIRQPWAWLLVLATMVLILGFVLGWVRMGAVQTWALFKLAGWFALLYYALFAALLVLAGPRGLPARFAAWFLAGLSAVVLVHVTLTLLGIRIVGFNQTQLLGLMGNPTATGLAAVCGLALSLSQMLATPPGRLRIFWEAMAIFAAAGILHTGSLSSILAGALAIIVFLMAGRDARAVIRAVYIAALLFILPRQLNMALGYWFPEAIKPLNELSLAHKIETILPGGQEKHRLLYQGTIGLRIELITGALTLWRETPLFGSGLGVFWQQQLAAQDRTPQIIHSTPLWLLAELGIAGLAAFTGLFVSVWLYLRRAMMQATDPRGARAWFLFAGLVVLACWALMSGAHELMYQRLPWFVTGLCAGLALRPEEGGRNTGRKTRKYSR